MLGKYSIDENGDTTLPTTAETGQGRQARLRQGHQGPDRQLRRSQVLQRRRPPACGPDANLQGCAPHGAWKPPRSPSRTAAARQARRRRSSATTSSGSCSAARFSYFFVERPHSRRSTTSRRALQRHDLGADRARLHARLRHHRADQLRPRRGLHDRLVRLGLDLRDARRHRSTGDRSGSILGARSSCSRSRCSARGVAQRDDRARRLPAAAQRAEAGAADHRDRHVASSCRTSACSGARRPTRRPT